MSDLCCLDRAAAADAAEHLAARDGTRCPICGAEPGVACTYVAFGGLPAGQHWPDRVHLRRLRTHLGLQEPGQRR